MALGGGTFVTQNKVLPGAYINFVSLSSGVNTFGERGVSAIAAHLNWGNEGVQVITKEDFQKNSLKIFGYDYTAPYLTWARDFFKHGNTMIFYCLNDSKGKASSNSFATAVKIGARGNDIRIAIQRNVDDESKFDVTTYLDTIAVDCQTVGSASELVKNDFVLFNTSATLSETAGTPLTGGENSVVTGVSVQNWLNEMEGYTFNSIGLLFDEPDYQNLLVEWTKRMRDSVGKKFQAVVNLDSTSDMSAGHEGIVIQANCGDDTDYSVAWLCGALAGCEINKSLTNMLYDGEMRFDKTNYTQIELENFINNGYFCFHNVNDEIRVLLDINSLTEFTEEKGKVFSNNQTIRVCDQIAMDIAVIFNTRYLGIMPNDKAGRIALWGDIVKHARNLESLRAIEDFNDTDVVVEQGEGKGSVVVNENITVVNTMEKLYMTVKVN
jgi:phage tail sheath protein